jgi:hypothetical protein
MTNLSPAILSVFAIFSPLFSQPTYKNGLQLFIGHILCKGRHTIAEILRTIGLKNIKNYSKYHWILSRAKWSAFEASKKLLLTLSKLCGSEIIISIDSTIERRKGARIKGLGRQRDPVKSTKSNKVLTIGLNWLVCAMHTKFPWTNQAWACPFLTILMPPERPLSSSRNRSDLEQKKRHKPLNKWASQSACFFRRLLGKTKNITIVADSSFATYQLANTCIDLGINFISRMRLDARLFAFPEKTKKGRPRLVGKRLSSLENRLKNEGVNWKELRVNWYGGKQKNVLVLSETCLWYGYGIRPVPIRWVLIKTENEVVALFSTNINILPNELIEKFVGRWQIEVTFEESRRHLGIETQRQWADAAIARTTPSIFASFSIINLIALELTKEKKEAIPIQTTSWYQKNHVCFSDVLSYIRLELLMKKYLLRFTKKSEPQKSILSELIYLLAAG